MVSAMQWNHVSSPGVGRMAVDPSGNLWLVTNNKLSKWTNNHWESESLPNYATHLQTNVIFSSDGQPHIISSDVDYSSYEARHSISYMSKTASGWSHETIYANADNYTESCSGTFDANGNLYVAYVTEWDKHALYLAKRNNDNTWTSEPVDTAYNAAWWPEVRIDPNGRFWIAYTTGNTDDLKVAYKWPDKPWNYATLDSNGVTGWQTRFEIDENGRKTYAYYNRSQGSYNLLYERANGTLARVMAPGRTNTEYQFDLTLMGDNAPLIAYTLNLTNISNAHTPVYCAWYKTSDAPVTFQVGDGELFDSYGFWDYKLEAQAVGNTLFINGIKADGSTETWWATVPEPSSIVALLAGIAGLGLIRRRK